MAFFEYSYTPKKMAPPHAIRAILGKTPLNKVL
eukprot:CAMPEP_0184352528 /NCGR_PEP_ID=MMETSP1089-20130417/66982_1 /TAXON_ID=38269 ORGANISM="Gloeochaete wittrockiana, Strain SAG46.84" /NCGR_SAMPLE_ID=MMETSP1089 /ASSEMBLY_ACC=CAM_ASM_000445 /LENGTH=32 /DNA_ID= /DNA_START= /DNA_END= /DNA_ORIENTATION=